MKNALKKGTRRLRWLTLASTVAALGVLLSYLTPIISEHLQPRAFRQRSALYTDNFPANTRFQEELLRLREKGTLTRENEQQILNAIKSANKTIEVPESLLWCLLFQESRFNHLSGIDSEAGASGLGQFSYFSFYEVNHHLTRFSDANLALLEGTLGQDVRPIEPRKSDLYHPSSYYHIPTAVVASAAYLNNRYLQLTQTLKKQNYKYDPELLWMYAAMAYNKGARSVYSFWNEAHQRGGTRLVQSIVAEPDAFVQATQSPAHFRRALKRIWPETEASRYSSELHIHLQNIRQCAIVDHRKEPTP